MRRQTLKLDGVSYAVEANLGRGGTADVLRVRSSIDDQVYALKRIEKDARSERRNERFRNEIAFGLSASNEHVLRIHAHHEDQKYFYYTMKCYPKNLRQVIADESNYGLLLDYLAQLCDGLAYVHGEGVVHRDIKPENILVDTHTHRLVLADFGIAHFKDSTLTARGDLLANRNYQAPEQMIKGNAKDVGKPADVFALGLIFTEVFTKQNARGARHLRIGHVHPFLSELDPLIERMTLQDGTQRIGIGAVRDSLEVIRRQARSGIEEIIQDLRASATLTDLATPDSGGILEQAGEDVLSSAYIFERADDEELVRYNPNYHCQISYRVSQELYNACVHSRLYSICKAKFEYEGTGSWSTQDFDTMISPRKRELLNEFESIQAEYPVDGNSPWGVLPRLAAHYARFLKEYHCEELMQRVRSMLSDSGPGTLRDDLLDAPILWIARSVKAYIATDRFSLTPSDLRLIDFRRNVRVDWDGTRLHELRCNADGAHLFHELSDAKLATDVLEALVRSWRVSVAERMDGRYAIYFRPRAEYDRFRAEALALAAPHNVFEADVQDLLRTEADYNDLVAVIWEPVFDIPSTLAKILGLREIS